MVLALKPFGCMPSSQSDGVQSAVINKFKDMIFLPIETSGEGEVNAHSRVQMALGEAKVKAKTEFEQCLKSTGKSLDDIKGYIAEHPELRRPFYHVPHREGVAGTAAQFILHVSDRMDSRQSRFRAACLARKRRGGHSERAFPTDAVPISRTRQQLLHRRARCTTISTNQRSRSYSKLPGLHKCRTTANSFMVGLDVGSTTVKATSSSMRPPTRFFGRTTSATRPSSRKRRSNFCAASNRKSASTAANTRMFVTGSGGGARRADRREVRAGSHGGFARRGEAASRSVFGDRAGRAGRQDHRLQGRRRKRPQERKSPR
jgi:hypothetical protein